MLLSVLHATTYRYADTVSRSTQYIRLTPYNCMRQRTISWNVQMPAAATQLADAFDNTMHVLTIVKPYQELRLVASGKVEVNENDDGEPAGRLNPIVFLRPTALTGLDDSLRDFIAPMSNLIRSRPFIGMTDLSAAILQHLPYQKGYTQVEFTAAQSFAAGRGVCQDHSHVFITCARYLGIPARYVSGYLSTSDNDQVESHAWVEVWISNRWISFDVSNGCQAGGGHLKLAIGLDYADACPVRGVRLGGGDEELWTAARVKSTQQ